MLSGALMILIVLLNQSKILAKTYESCHTPRGEEGECIAIRECGGLYTLLGVMPLPHAYGEYLKKSHCGFIGKIPKVCCSKDDITPRAAKKTQNITETDDEVPILTRSNLPKNDECGTYVERKIYGGESAELDEFPWMALLIYELPSHVSGYGCGGTLISKRYVLTAAHCLKGKDLNKLWKLVAVRLGEYNKDSDRDCFHNGFAEECLKTPPINILVEERIPHELYDPFDHSQKHDIALLRLKQDVIFNNYIIPICLPLHDTERNKTYIDKNLVVAGWGQTEKNNFSSSIKLKVRVPVKSNDDCNEIYKKASVRISTRQLCAGGEKNKNSCKGDSGGSLMTVGLNENGDPSWYAAGIVSFGTEKCGKEGWPAVYTRVSKYLGWIFRNMKP
ncbi:hypothetical protein WA026_002976 [Henosepilachna vigintioctopunctata]|uniref:CLIP domain-containing serine protease n=1 Tax=Henosepilachna vigintioctopunctata TaxID=420089 RepID=A0AAW1THT4_9CUCU